MALTSLADVQQLLNLFVKNNGIDLTGSPHLDFWNTSYSNFIGGNVPGVQDPNNPNQGLPILNKINGMFDGPSSNIVKALAGTPPLFANSPNAPIGQMPYNGPYMPADQIQEISDWISAQCPDPEAVVQRSPKRSGT